MAKVSNFSSIRLKLASPENILQWSKGEVTKPETINYRTQKPEKDGLFCERIFGPEKDYECYCGKYRRIRYKGIVCDKCGVEVTRSVVRRERMGHISLAVPVAHIWFLRGVPSRMGLLLDIPVTQLERVIYYAAYIVTAVDEEKRKEMQKSLEDEFKRRSKEIKDKEEKDELKSRYLGETDNLKQLRSLLVLSETAYHDLSLKYGEIFSASIGAEAVRNIFIGMDLASLKKKLQKEITGAKGPAQQKLQRRLSLVRRMVDAGIRPEWMFLTALPVLPPELRPMVQLDGGRYATSDLNDLYRRVINRNNRLKKLQDINAPEVISRNEKRMLQEAVDALIDNSARKSQTVTATTGGRRLLKSLADMLKGKQGRFRQNLLGKRVDYSGRSVIVIGPNLSLNQCGLPKKMALELFRPFVIRKVIENELAYNVRAANRLIEQAPPEVWALLEEVIEGKYVLLNRAPTLHRLGIQAFKPVLIEGNAIQIHPLVCTAFNADFDGDQMAVHVPLSEEAQNEAKNLMLSTENLLKPATGSPIINPQKDLILGSYWMSKIQEGANGEGRAFGTFEDAVLAYDSGIIDMNARIKVYQTEKGSDGRYIETSVGRIIFHQILPKDFPFTNKELDSAALRNITADILVRYSKEESSRVLDAITRLGFEYATISGISWAMGDLNVPKEKPAILERARKEVEVIKGHFSDGLLSPQERHNLITEVWIRAKGSIADLVSDNLDPNGSVRIISDSGARGTSSQLNQMAGMVGLVSNPAGETIELPIEASFKEGFTSLEYFISTHGARKGTADTALRTATAGYLTRRLVDVAQDIVITTKNCKDKKGYIIRRKDFEITGQPLEDKLFGRILAEDVKGAGKKVLAKAGDEVSMELASLIEKDSTVTEVTVRSPLSCKIVNGLCATCYGWDLGYNSMVAIGTAIGIIAAQAIGEPGTQLTMRTFHTGGVAGGGDITQGLPRVEEIFEARPPKGRAIIVNKAGTVEEIVEKEGERIVRIRSAAKETKETEEEDVAEYSIPSNIRILLEKGDVVGPGSQITEGNIDPKEFYANADIETVQRYIVNSVQQIYVSQGATIHDKHIEVIARQMFSRVKIDDSGDSKFSPGEILDVSVVAMENEKLKNKATYTPLLLGVTKVALTTESFLSAASFQETTRVLIEAAVEGRVDRLKGLKENVIIGKIIPAGTGYKAKIDK